MDALLAGTFVIGVYLIFILIGIAAYVLRAIGLYTMAKKRAIENAWLAFIPVGDAYIMGKLSLGSSYMRSKFPKIHVIFPSLIGGYLGLILLLIGGVFASIAFGPAGFIGIILMYGLIFLAALFILVVHYFVLYHVYNSQDPDNAVLFLILCIVLRIEFIILFIIRNKQPQEFDNSTSQTLPPYDAI